MFAPLHGAWNGRSTAHTPAIRPRQDEAGRCCIDLATYDEYVDIVMHGRGKRLQHMVRRLFRSQKMFRGSRQELAGAARMTY